MHRRLYNEGIISENFLKFWNLEIIWLNRKKVQKMCSNFPDSKEPYWVISYQLLSLHTISWRWNSGENSYFHLNSVLVHIKSAPWHGNPLRFNQPINLLSIYSDERLLPRTVRDDVHWQNTLALFGWGDIKFKRFKLKMWFLDAYEWKLCWRSWVWRRDIIVVSQKMFLEFSILIFVFRAHSPKKSFSDAAPQP